MKTRKPSKKSLGYNEAELNAAITQEVKRRRSLKISEFSAKLAKTKTFNFTKGKVWPILLPFFIVMIFLIILPLVSILIYSLVKPTGNAQLFRITLENFVKMFTSKNIMVALLLSIAYAVAAALVAIVFGYPIALIMSEVKSKVLVKNMWILVTMPIWISMLLKVLGLKSFFYLLMPSAIGTPFAVIIGMVYMFLPFAIIPIYDSLEMRQIDLEEAARDLGMSSWKTFWHITFRSSLPGVLTAFTLVIVQAATSLIVIRYMGDGKINLISSIIESYFFKGNNFGFGAAISVVLTIFVFLLTLLIRWSSNRLEGKRGKNKWKNSSEPTILPL
ncbi:ABC-type spermidine/putrescine transport system permease subunit I [Entomoplasma freundtii]|uniref:Spermidine/putrescine ABC transporter permease n=1 Tax=Entomoplasma freundtii TaxID=74700 RepID=A0A2K8NQX1_9MOLU|nr:spermidine/putrescine ABC transporter permease [Entomoplasma freundtii]ATZ16184.1 spermidine/putrescine ABC transporter permease [Entomoplasma freundtii]TDY56915.1 ABC-type spermidine/putrescine transport system permease subunit I [Entomoplasma freundtii]